MLSEIAINDPKAFTELVKVALDGKAGKVTKSEKVIESEVTIKGSEKKSTTTKKADPKKEDLSKLSLADLKAKAKDKGVKGYSTMKKADLIDALK